jgi:hypothetical protein
LGIATDLKTVLANQDNFNIRLRAIEESGRNRNQSGPVTKIKLPIQDTDEMESIEELLEKEPPTREQLVIIK